MKDILDTVIEKCVAKKQRLDVVRRYLRIKYRIRIDQEAIELRARNFHGDDVQAAA